MVTGKRQAGSNAISWGSGDTSGTGGVHFPPGADDTHDPTPPPADEDIITISKTFTRPLTASEAASFENMKATIAALEIAIKALADNAKITFSNGVTVTGAQLKAIWATTDFVINDNASYSNGGGGEANWNYGDQKVSFNVQYLDDYDNFTGGMNYLVAHEMGHLTQAGNPAGNPYYTNQQVANDVARSILATADLDCLVNPGFGYSTTDAVKFVVPSPPPPA